MKFKQNEESEKVEMSNPLEEGFIDLIQFEITKLNLISSAKCYFYKNGLMDYKKFFKTLYKNCEEIKHCLVAFVTENGTELPEFKIPEAIVFSNIKEPTLYFLKSRCWLCRVCNHFFSRRLIIPESMSISLSSSCFIPLTAF